MFVETYYDERAAVPTSAGEPIIPYPELSGQELMLWRKYLPVRREITNLSFWFYDTVPPPVIEEIEKARKAPRLFERIEIWSRSTDPMAIGVIGGDKTRYFSIARWGDAKLTLEQVKKKLWLEKVLPCLAFAGLGLVFFLAAFLHLS